MVFTRKDGIFMGYVSFREGTPALLQQKTQQIFVSTVIVTNPSPKTQTVRWTPQQALPQQARGPSRTSFKEVASSFESWLVNFGGTGLMSNDFFFPFPMTDPWDWHTYLHEWLIFMVFM